MTEIDYLKCKLEDAEKAFDKLHKRYIELLKKQGKLEKENEQLRKDVENLQEVVAELGATLLMHGFEIEINDENLSEMIDNG